MNLNYQEALELANRVAWKTEVCFSGSDCWCEIVKPELDITDKDGNDIVIISSAAVSKVNAKQIIQAHNFYIKNYRDGFELGDIVKKKSGKPFKSGYDTLMIIEFGINQTDPKLRSCAIFDDGTICNLDQLELFIREKKLLN
jgi:hypothetical protein